MKNTNITEFRKLKPTEKEPFRTRPYVSFTCFHCNTTTEVAKASFKVDKPCKECIKRLRGRANFEQKAKEKFGDKFTLHLDTYFDYTSPMEVTCNIHNHRYTIKPVHFVANAYENQPHKGGCPKCAQDVNKTKNSRSIDHYLRALNDKFPEMKVVSHGNADTNLEHITLSCRVHGEFIKTLADIIKTDSNVSNLCPTCSKEKHAWRVRAARTDIPGIVYFVHFKDVNLYKCGVTYKTVQERLRGHLHNIDIIWTIPFTALSDAYFFEYQFFREYNNSKTRHPDNTLGGYTEFFNNLIQKPTKRFIEEILCRKESNSGELPPSIDEDNPERSPITGTCND